MFGGGKNNSNQKRHQKEFERVGTVGVPDNRASLTLHPTEEDLCGFCSKPEDQMFQLFVRPAFLDGSKIIWVHDNCALHTPEVYEGALVDDCYLEVFNCVKATGRAKLLK